MNEVRTEKIKCIILLLGFLFTKAAFGQSKSESKGLEIWPQRINLGLNYGIPNSPCVNIGFKLKDKYYWDFIVEMKKQEEYSAFMNLGYQINKLTSFKTQGQIGLSLMQIPNKLFTDKHTKLGINIKLIQPIARKFGAFISGNFGWPDNRIESKELYSINIGAEIYFRRIPFILY